MRFMVTLTFGRPAYFLTDARRALTGWMEGRGHRRGGGAGAQFFGGVYVAVPERHRSGAWHWHILTDRRIRVEALRASWSAYNGVRCRTHHKRFSDARAGAAYAAKYVGKAMETAALGSHRYHVGEGATPPPSTYGLVLADDVYEAIWKVLPDQADGLARVVRVDTGAGPPAAWAGW